MGTHQDDDQWDRVGQQADRIDNLIHALQMPLNLAMHVEGLRASLPAIRDALRALVVEATGDDPWAN